MAKQTKPFVLEIKSSRRMRTRPAQQVKSIWGSFASDLKQSLAEKEEAAVSMAEHEHCTEVPDLVQAVAADHDETAISPSKSHFIEKWAAKRAEKPKAGAADMVATFLRRLERQKTLLAEFEADPSGFKSWRSAWFRKVNGGFGVSIGYDRIDAGGGLRYIVVETLRDVSEFLDDLGHHAQTDKNFQRALSESRSRRAGRRVGATAV
ncbi:hypothetical protein BSK43_031290 [Rhizobium sp. P44RR-XXIV]|nr:hypothetical protein BSK43_031290 [Rhizobium sp. P44RR-XXIV]